MGITLIIFSFSSRLMKAQTSEVLKRDVIPVKTGIHKILMNDQADHGFPPEFTLA